MSWRTLYVSSAIHLFTPDLENYLNDLNQCIKTWKKLNQISSCCLDKRRSGDKLELEGFSDAHWRISTSIHRMVLKKKYVHTPRPTYHHILFSDFWCAIRIPILNFLTFKVINLLDFYNIKFCMRVWNGVNKSFIQLN